MTEQEILQYANAHLWYLREGDYLPEPLSSMNGGRGVDRTERLEQIRTATLLASKDIYTTAEACMFLGVKRSYLYELVCNHKIPHFKSRGGKLTYFKRNDLEETVQQVKLKPKEI